MRDDMNNPLRFRVCPECVAGKHRNCNGDAWDHVNDRLDICDCDAAGHERCEFCGDPLVDVDTDCLDMLGHCVNCRMHCSSCTAFHFDVTKADWYVGGE